MEPLRDNKSPRAEDSPQLGGNNSNKSFPKLEPPRHEETRTEKEEPPRHEETQPRKGEPTAKSIDTPKPTTTPTTTTTTTITTTNGTGPSPSYPTTSVFRKRLLDIDDPLKTIPKYFFERVDLSSDDDVFFFKREAQWKRKSWRQCGSLVMSLLFGLSSSISERLSSQVRRAARALVHLGVQVGEKVCIFGKTRYEWFAFYLAALTVGAVPTSIGSSSSK